MKSFRPSAAFAWGQHAVVRRPQLVLQVNKSPLPGTCDFHTVPPELHLGRVNAHLLFPQRIRSFLKNKVKHANLRQSWALRAEVENRVGILNTYNVWDK